MGSLIITLIITAVFLLTFALIVLYQGLKERKKNAQMAETIRHLMHYRDVTFQNENVGQSEGEEYVDSELELLKLFKSVDSRIERELLFADPNFGRNELVRLFGTDKNVLPSVLRRFANTSVPGYINAKRMDYAVRLLKEHPEYTLGAIAEACGIKSPATFIRNFKNTYGMAPSEYRKAFEENSITPPLKLTFSNDKSS